MEKHIKHKQRSAQWGIAVGVLLVIIGIVIIIVTAEYADFYTYVYKAMVSICNGVKLIGITFGICVSAAGLIVGSYFEIKVMEAKCELIRENEQKANQINSPNQQDDNAVIQSVINGESETNHQEL